MSENNSAKPKGKTNNPNGRPKGVPNKNTALIRDMIAQALDNAGGVQYLTEVAATHPGPFLALVGKVMPVQVVGENGGAIQHSLTVNFVKPK